MFELIASIIVGGVAGWIASIIMKTNQQQGLLMDVIIGIVGGFLGGGLMGLLGIGTDNLIMSLLAAVIGACLLLYGLQVLRKRQK